MGSSICADALPTLGIDCDFEERCSIYLPGDMLDMRGLEHEAEMRQAAGLRSAMIGRKQLKTLSGIGTVRVPFSPIGTAEVKSRSSSRRACGTRRSDGA